MSDKDNMPNPEFEASRQRLDVQVGSLVKSESLIYRIEQIIDFESVVGTAVETGRSKPLRILELQSVPNDGSWEKSDPHEDMAGIGNSDWKVAEKRFAALQPLITAFSPGRREVELRAKEVGVDTATLYRWLQKYKGMKNVAALIPKKSGWIQGRGRIHSQAEGVIADVINNYYLTPQRPTPTKTVTEVLRQCQYAALSHPTHRRLDPGLLMFQKKRDFEDVASKKKQKTSFYPFQGVSQTLITLLQSFKLTIHPWTSFWLMTSIENQLAGLGFHWRWTSIAVWSQGTTCLLMHHRRHRLLCVWRIQSCQKTNG